MKDDFVNEVEVNLMANKVAVITGGGHGIGKARLKYKVIA